MVDPATNQAAVNANKDISPAVNGHSDSQSPLTNGVNDATVKNETASPPESPPLPSPVNQTSATQPETAPSNNSEVEVKAQVSETAESKSAATLPQDSTNNTAPADSITSRDTQQTQKTASEAAVTEDIKMENAPDTAQKSAASAVAGQLPHHPSPASKPETTSDQGSTSAPPAPAQQQVDQEMPDASNAPVSPTKVQRERDIDPSDEPAAKRTKTNGDAPDAPELKVPELPTPATDGPTETPMEGDTGITKVQHKFLLKGIQSLKRMHDARFYREPVDPIKMNIPHYPSIITHPMDLSTIEKKLKNNEYTSVQALVDDFNLMVNNALTFNGPDHLVTIEGQKLKATFDKQMANLPKPDEVEEKKPKKGGSAKTPARRATGQGAGRNASSPQGTTFALGPEGLPLIRRDSTNADGRPKRSIHPPKRDLPYTTKPKKKKYQWELRFCQEVLDELHKPKHYNYAAPFYYPVDPVALNIPTYHSIIKRPMDLSTVQTKLKTGQYENSKDFEVDMRQIFKNCFKFNIPGDPTYMAGKKLEEVFEHKWAQKARYLEAHDPHRQEQSADSSDEDSDEEEEDSDSDADQEKLQMLQRQIAEMSKQVEAITQKKKKTPPTSGKKSGKSKNGKKDSKKSGVGSLTKKDKKGTKGSKPEKQRWVTYHEKQIISNGISSLPDKKMQEALKIIQNNVPSLKVCFRCRCPLSPTFLCSDSD